MATNARREDSERKDATDDLADRLIEKRERFQYFVISAATAVLVFTFNNYNAPEGVLSQGPVWVTLLGWVALVLAILFAMLGISARHRQYADFLDRRERNERPTVPNLPTDVEKRRRGIKRLQSWMIWAFWIGVAALTGTAIFAIL